MARSKQTAADYIERHDEEMRIILGELVENAGRINMWWTLAHSTVRRDPQHAFELLIDAEIHLNGHVRLELTDSLRRMRAVINRLDAELPDDEDKPLPA